MNPTPALKEFEEITISEFNKFNALLASNYPINEECISITSYDDIRNIQDNRRKRLIIGTMEQIIIDYILRINLNHEKVDQLLSELKIQHISYDLITKITQLKLGLYMKYLH